MPKFQHYSFDLWLTLIKSNPSFKKERAKFFYKNYNFKNKQIEEVQDAFRKVDIMCNAINEKTGGNIDAEEMYLMVIFMINDYSLTIDKIDIQELYKVMDLLLFKYLPEIYCDDTVIVLNRIKQKDDITLNVLSNTGFIKGNSLRKVLDLLGLSDYFDFQIYSDEVGMSKPNRQLFLWLMKKVEEMKNTVCLPKSIIHIGDNPVADMAGAKAVGIYSLLINSNQLSILSLIEQ